MTKAKPICVAYYFQKEGEPTVEEMQAKLQRRFKDYHVLCVPKFENKHADIDFRVFYEKDKKYEELVKLVKKYE